MTATTVRFAAIAAILAAAAAGACVGEPLLDEADELDCQDGGCLPASCAGDRCRSDASSSSGEQWLPGQKQLGEDCVHGIDCASGFCAQQDGVCCATSCVGPCRSCLAVETHAPPGVCEPLPLGTPCGPLADRGGIVPGAMCNGQGWCDTGTALPPSSPYGDPY
jgi:hypothetical protein